MDTSTLETPHTADAASGSSNPDISHTAAAGFGRFRRLAGRPIVAIGVIVALGALGGCARQSSLDPLAPGIAMAPADGPAPTTTPTPTTLPVTTTSWPRPSLPKLSTEPGVITPPTHPPGDLTNDTLVPPTTDMTMGAIRTLIDPHGESSEIVALAWGDVDRDGDIDAVVLTTWCGASCGKQLDLVINNGGTPSLYSSPQGNAFEPWFIPAGAVQSSDLSATIEPSSTLLGATITLTGRGLCGEVPMSADPDGPCDHDLVRTATYIFHDGTLNPSSIQPPLELNQYLIDVLVNPSGEAASVNVVAWGDIDGDGSVDAVVQSGWCDASCGTQLDLVLNDVLGPRLYNPEPFAPYYNGGGAAQSSLTAVTIDDSPETRAEFGGSMIRLAGSGLCDSSGQSSWSDCGPTERIFLFAEGELAPWTG